MKKTRSPLAYVYLSLFIITSTAIIIFASLSGEVSSEQSSTLLNIVVKITTIFKINLSQTQLDGLHLFIRKAIGHFGIFLLDGAFALLSIHYWTGLKTRTKFVVALSTGIFIAGLSEVIQMLAPNRGPAIGDVIIDFFGFFVGTVIVYWLLNLTSQKQNKKIRK